MVIIRFRSEAELEHTLKKLKKMHKFTKELIECFEEKIEEDDDENYSYDEDDDYDEEDYSPSKVNRRRMRRRNMK